MLKAVFITIPLLLTKALIALTKRSPIRARALLTTTSTIIESARRCFICERSACDLCAAFIACHCVVRRDSKNVPLITIVLDRLAVPVCRLHLVDSFCFDAERH